jgi:hypothetical protein
MKMFTRSLQISLSSTQFQQEIVFLAFLQGGFRTENLEKSRNLVPFVPHTYSQLYPIFMLPFAIPSRI